MNFRWHFLTSIVVDYSYCCDTRAKFTFDDAIFKVELRCVFFFRHRLSKHPLSVQVQLPYKDLRRGEEAEKIDTFQLFPNE